MHKFDDTGGYVLIPLQHIAMFPTITHAHVILVARRVVCKHDLNIMPCGRNGLISIVFATARKAHWLLCGRLLNYVA